jgi:hypothetical protein
MTRFRMGSSTGLSRRTMLAGAGAMGAAIGLNRLSSAAAQDASPVPTPFPRTNHPVIGSWQWTPSPVTFSNNSFAIFTADGTYIEAETGRIVGVGTRRATGERTAELVSLPRRRVSLDKLYEPGSAVVQDPFVSGPEFFITRLAIEVDASGNRMNASGTSETQDAGGTIVGADAYTGYADRMVLVAAAASTPTA